jgi:hypothetical protein
MSISSRLVLADEDEGAQAVDGRDPEAHEQGLLARAEEPQAHREDQGCEAGDEERQLGSVERADHRPRSLELRVSGGGHERNFLIGCCTDTVLNPL